MLGRSPGAFSKHGPEHAKHRLAWDPLRRPGEPHLRFLPKRVAEGIRKQLRKHFIFREFRNADYPGALWAYVPGIEERRFSQELSESKVFEFYRDYMKHEDSLLGSRLNSYLTMNTFLIGGSVVILGAMIQLMSNNDLSRERMLFLIAGAAFVHCVIAYIGHKAAELTRSSLMAATHSLAILRDKGNHRLRQAIARGDLPHLSNARGLSAHERHGLDQGTDIMRGIPRMMKSVWLVMALVPVPLLASSVMAVATCPGLEVAREASLPPFRLFLRHVLCVSPKPTSVKVSDPAIVTIETNPRR